jgi:hypothetical protein
MKHHSLASFCLVAGLLLALAPLRGMRAPEREQYPPYVERVPVQLRQAWRDLLGSGDVLRFGRGLRHALLPMLDRA